MEDWEGFRAYRVVSESSRYVQVESGLVYIDSLPLSLSDLDTLFEKGFCIAAHERRRRKDGGFYVSYLFEKRPPV